MSYIIDIIDILGIKIQKLRPMERIYRRFFINRLFDIKEDSVFTILTHILSFFPVLVLISYKKKPIFLIPFFNYKNSNTRSLTDNIAYLLSLKPFTNSIDGSNTVLINIGDLSRTHSIIYNEQGSVKMNESDIVVMNFFSLNEKKEFIEYLIDMGFTIYFNFGDISIKEKSKELHNYFFLYKTTLLVNKVEKIIIMTADDYFIPSSGDLYTVDEYKKYYQNYINTNRIKNLTVKIVLT